MSSDNELEVMHQIREVERALATHRVHSASSRETIKQIRANIDLACRVKEQLSGAVNNFRVRLILLSHFSIPSFS